MRATLVTLVHAPWGKIYAITAPSRSAALLIPGDSNAIVVWRPAVREDLVTVAEAGPGARACVSQSSVSVSSATTAGTAPLY